MIKRFKNIAGKRRRFAEHPAATSECLTAAATTYVTEKFGRQAKRTIIYVPSLQTRLSRSVTGDRVIIIIVFVRSRSRKIRIENTTTSTTTRRRSSLDLHRSPRRVVGLWMREISTTIVTIRQRQRATTTEVK